MKIYVLTTKNNEDGISVRGAYVTKKLSQDAMKEYLGKYHCNGFTEFQNDESFEPDPCQVPINAETLADVLNEMHYENDWGEWADITETELEGCGADI